MLASDNPWAGPAQGFYHGYHFELHAFDSATRPGALFIIWARNNADEWRVCSARHLKRTETETTINIPY